MIEHLFLDTAKKMTTTRNKFGEVVYSTAGVDIFGRLRDHLSRYEVNQIESTVGRASNVIATFWCSPNALTLDDIILCRGNYYRVVAAVNANNFSTTEVQFTKCYLEFDRGTIS